MVGGKRSIHDVQRAKVRWVDTVVWKRTVDVKFVYQFGVRGYKILLHNTYVSSGLRWSEHDSLSPK